MKGIRRAAAALCLVLAAGAGSPAQDGPPPAGALAPAERKQVEAWIADLEHREHDRRAAATEALRAFGVRALPLLREAAEDRREETRARARLLVTVLDAHVGGEDPASGWLTLKGDMARTGSRGEAPGRGLAVVASRSVAAGMAGGARPPDAPLASADGLLVVAAGDRISAFGTGDLGHRWSAGVGSRVLASPVIAAGRVYVGTSKGLTALSTEDGVESWTVSAAYGVGAAPLISGNTLFACLMGEGVVALDPATGSQRWEFRCDAGSAAPVVAADRVILGTRGAEVVALDAATGRPAWRVPVDGMVSFAPAAVGSFVLVGDGGRRLRCLDAESGRVLWTRSVKGRFAGEGPAVSRRAVVIALDSTEMEAYDPATGARLWNRWLGTRHLSSPTLAGGVVIFGSRNRLVAVGAETGDDAWEVGLDAEVSCPLVADRTVYALAGTRVTAIR